MSFKPLRKRKSRSTSRTPSKSPVNLSKLILQERDRIQQEKQLVPDYYAQIDQYQEEMEQCTKRWQIRKRKRLQRQIKQLQRKIDQIESGEFEEKFEETVRPFLEQQERQYHIKEIQKSHQGNQNSRGTRRDEKKNPDRNERGMTRFLKKVQQSNDPVHGVVLQDFLRFMKDHAPPIRSVEHDTCPDCMVPLVNEPDTAILACPQCGTSSRFLDATSTSMAYGEEVEFAVFSYQRYGHFNEHITQVQAKESTQVPDSVLQKVQEQLYRNRIYNVAKITPKKIHDVLKTLVLSRYYKQTIQIWAKITGNPPPRMTPRQESQNRLMFKAVQAPFEKHCPKERTNFLSYAYCLYKFNELLGYDHFLPYFQLLKGRDKLIRQDETWKKICEELDWEFIPSI